MVLFHSEFVKYIDLKEEFFKIIKKKKEKRKKKKRKPNVIALVHIELVRSHGTGLKSQLTECFVALDTINTR